MLRTERIARLSGRLVILFALCGALVMGVHWASTVDAQQPATNAGFRAYSLRHVDAKEAANQLQKMIQPGTADVYMDTAKNQVIVKGDDRTQQMASQILTTIDRPAPSQASSAPQAAGNRVKGYRVIPSQVEAIAAELARRFPASTGVRVVPDTRTSQVVVIGTEAVHQQVDQLMGVARPAQQPVVSAQPDTNEMMLQNLTWRQFETALRTMLGGQMGVGTDSSGAIATIDLPSVDGKPRQMQLDRRTGRLQVSGKDELTRAWLQVARNLDKPGARAGEATQAVPVKKADPAVVENAIAKVRRAEEAAGDVARTVPVRNPSSQPRWGGDLVSAIFAQQPAAEDDEPDVAEPGAEDPVERIVGGDMEGGMTVDGEPTGLIGQVQIEFVEGLGVFIVKGQKADVEKVIKLIEQIDAMTGDTQPTILIHPLQNVNSVVLSELIEELYDDVFGTRLSPVNITPLDKPNALLLIGREESMASILDLIEKLDQPVPPATQLKVFQLKYMSAVDAETQVRDFFSDEPSGGGGGGGGDNRPGLGIRVRVLADFRTNALIVNASPRDMAEISHLIEKLDVEAAAAENQLRVFRLENALADDLQAVLQEAITGVAPGAPGGAGAPGGGGGAGGTAAQVSRQSSRLSILTVDQDGNRTIESGIPGGVSVTADPNVNALVVRAPAKSMDLIEELIQQLDQLPSAEAKIKVFQLENGDATSLTILLQELFGLQVTAGQSTSTAAFNSALTSAAAAAGESSLVPIRFAVDQRTNSIIASGSGSDLDVVEVLLLRLDQSDVEARKTEVYRLKNAPAADVANAISTFLNTQRQLVQQQLLLAQAVSPFEQIDREVIVVAEPVTNSVIVSATPRYFDQIMQVIDDLDYRLKMVMVQVIVAEVELSDGTEMGVEFGLQDSLLADRGLVLGTNVTQSQIASGETLAGLATSALGVGRNSATFGYGGMVLSAANESVNVIIRALQDEGRLQVLSRPQIMTLDGVEAFVQVGARVPRLTGTTITNTGQVNNTEDVDVGMLLTVRPRVSPDGLVIMEVGAEKSSVGNPEDGIPVAITNDGPVLSPQILTTTANTVVSAQSGQTVVFAGLITTNKTTNRRAVPYLGEMPYLGPLFRYDQTSEKRTELLIIMTPHVLDGDEDVDEIKHIESDRMSWALSDVIEIHGDADLSPGRGLWGEDEDTSTIFPDLDPSGMKGTKAAGTDGDLSENHLMNVLPGTWQDPSRAKNSAARPVRLPRAPEQPAAAGPPPPAPTVQPSSYQQLPTFNAQQ